MDGDVGLNTAVALANCLAVRPVEQPSKELRRILAVDPPSIARLTDNDVAPMIELAEHVLGIVERLIVADVDAAAAVVNDMLARHSAHPHLALEDGRWRLHHHPPDAELIPMWTAISADAFARLIHAEQHDRLGRCDAPDCEQIYLDASKNQSRRFCSTTCQNRVKSAAYRRRRTATNRET